jgi:hypothetical protein
MAVADSRKKKKNPWRRWERKGDTSTTHLQASYPLQQQQITTAKKKGRKISHESCVFLFVLCIIISLDPFQSDCEWSLFFCNDWKKKKTDRKNYEKEKGIAMLKLPNLLKRTRKDKGNGKRKQKKKKKNSLKNFLFMFNVRHPLLLWLLQSFLFHSPSHLHFLSPSPFWSCPQSQKEEVFCCLVVLLFCWLVVFRRERRGLFVVASWRRKKLPSHIFPLLYRKLGAEHCLRMVSNRHAFFSSDMSSYFLLFLRRICCDLFELLGCFVVLTQGRRRFLLFLLFGLTRRSFLLLCCCCRFEQKRHCPHISFPLCRDSCELLFEAGE